MAHVAAQPDRRRLILLLISAAQLIVVFNDAIMNVALPSAQADLHISDGGRQWVITAYTLAFGGLLLLGGRLGDMFGRKRIFVTGLIGFVVASAFGGIATASWMLLSARALQGAFGALLAPAALSLISLTFPDGKDRAKAFGVFASVVITGGAVGLLAGGLLTEYLSWRWALFINIPLAVLPVLGALAYIHDHSEHDRTTRLDIPGAVLATAGIVALVYGFTLAESHGWGDGTTLVSFAVAVFLLVAFALVQARTRDPLLPFRILTERNRLGAYLSAALALLSAFGVILFLTYYLQAVKGYSAAQTGVAFLPMAIAQIIGAAQIGARLMTRVRPRTLMTIGYLLAAASVLLLLVVDTDTSYGPVLLSEIGVGLGLGLALMPATSLATHGIGPRDSGVASAMINISQQVGGSIGTALLNTIATSTTAAYLVSHGTGQQSAAMVHGYRVGYLWAAAFLVAAGLASFLLINTGRPEAEDDLVDAGEEVAATV
ncbi:DHA2 family efflux MFS transporter permease subunit [Streptomyces sp. NPDC026673]|uniref:DHA2 family efflux MFS transporter permease subunit n=1 Tax=Streptomyces sp. NPDC026673 TaxID=3155724 RepID=UPI0033FA83E6